MAEYSEDAEVEDSFDGPEPMDEVEYQGYVGSAIKSAVDYIDLELGEDRAEATDLYRVLMKVMLTLEVEGCLPRCERHGPTDSALPHANVFWL